MHAIQGSNQGRLSTSRGADEGSYGVGFDHHVDVLYGKKAAVVDIE